MSSKSFNYSHNPFNICPKTNEKLATLPSTSPLKEGQVYIKTGTNSDGWRQQYPILIWWKPERLVDIVSSHGSWLEKNSKKGNKLKERVNKGTFLILPSCLGTANSCRPQHKYFFLYSCS